MGLADNIRHACPTERPRLCSAADAFCLLGHDLARSPTETLRIAHLDGTDRLLALVEQQGGHEKLLISLGALVRDACIRRTRRIVILHNHPSGDPRPSIADRLATRRLAESLRLIEVDLVDHLIVARGGVTSFRGSGLL